MDGVFITGRIIHEMVARVSKICPREWTTVSLRTVTQEDVFNIDGQIHPQGQKFYLC